MKHHYRVQMNVVITILAHVLYAGFIIYFPRFLVQFSYSVLSDSSWPRGPQQVRPPCPYLCYCAPPVVGWMFVAPVKWSISCHINKQGCHSNQRFQMWISEPEGIQEKQCLLSGSHSPWLALAPDSWDAYKRNDFSKTRLLHLSIHRKALNAKFLNLKYLVFLN